MSHLNGFTVKDRWGKYFAIQTNTREGGKVRTHHIRYIGKNAIQLKKIRYLQDKESLRSIPLEFLIDEEGKHIISPESIQEALINKVENMGAIDQRAERWARQWAGKKEDEDFTYEDLHELVKDRLNYNDYTTKSILTITSKEGQEYLEDLRKLEELELEAISKSENFRLNQTVNDEGQAISIKSLNDEVLFESDSQKAILLQQQAQDEIPIQQNPAKQYEQLQDILNTDLSKFENEEDQMEWAFLSSKLHGKEKVYIGDLNADDVELISKYFDKYGSINEIKRFDSSIKETAEIRLVKEKIEAFNIKHGKEVEHITNLALNGEWDKLKVDLEIDYDHRHYKQDLECIYADVKEYQALKLVKQLTKNQLEGKDKVKSSVIRESLELNSFDEIRNVYASHFSYKFGCEFVDSKGLKPITLPQYEKGRVREFLNFATKNGYLLKQLNREGERETTYIPNFIDTVNNGKTSLLRKAHFDVETVKREAKEIAKIKLESKKLGEEDYSTELQKEIEKQTEKFINKFKQEAITYVDTKQKEQYRKYTPEQYNKAVEHRKLKLIREFAEQSKENKIIKIVEKRLKDKNIDSNSSEYKQEFAKVKKWYEKKLKIQTKKEEFNLMRKYTLSKKSISRFLNTENLDFFENVHKSNIAGYEKKVQEEEKRRGRKLNREETGKLYFQQNINKLFGKYLTESREIESLRGKKNRTDEEDRIANKKTLYDRGIKNLQEFSFMLQLASKDNGSLLEGTRSALEVFDIAEVFNSKK